MAFTAPSPSHSPPFIKPPATQLWPCLSHRRRIPAAALAHHHNSAPSLAPSLPSPPSPCSDSKPVSSSAHFTATNSLTNSRTCNFKQITQALHRSTCNHQLSIQSPNLQFLHQSSPPPLSLFSCNQFSSQIQPKLPNQLTQSIHATPAIPVQQINSRICSHLTRLQHHHQRRCCLHRTHGGPSSLLPRN